MAIKEILTSINMAKNLIYRCGRLLLTLLCLFLFMPAFANTDLESNTCRMGNSKKSEIIYLDTILRKNSDKYMVYYQNKLSDWGFETYLFLGKYGEQYLVSMVGENLPLISRTIEKEYFEMMYQKSLNFIGESESNSNKTKSSYCRTLTMLKNGSLDTIDIGEIQRNSKYYSHFKELDRILLYLGEH